MRRVRKSLVFAASFVVAAVFVWPLLIHGQEGKAKSNGKPRAASAAEFSEKDWPDLVARKKDFLAKLDKAKKQFESADEEGKQKIVKQFRSMQQEFSAEVQPGLMQLAPKIYAKDPTDVDAAEVVITEAFQDNKYRQVLEMVGKVTEAGKTSPALLTFQGISQFATHDFANAKKTLTQARAADENVFPVIGKPFLEACEPYIGYWKAEQAIRAKEKEAGDLPLVQFKTTKGDIVFELFENEAPNTVANFINLVENKKYDGIGFHRVIPNFMAQGGDPNTLDDDPQNDGQGGPGYTIPCECFKDDARMHFQGTLSMAHAGKDTGGSQFFITHLPTPHLNPNTERESGHTVFGRIVKGMDVAMALRIGDTIESAKVLRKRDHEYKPKTLADPRRPSTGKKPATKKKASE